VPFGLSNAPSTFQDIMNHIFSDIFDLGLLTYMDNILIYTKTEDEHDSVVREFLQWLQTNELVVSPEKCVWGAQEVEFLGYVIRREGVKISTDKVEAVLSWKIPTSLTEGQSFLGFANFYRRFIKNYSWVARLLTKLIIKERKDWAWNMSAKQAFQELKYRFITAPILTHFDTHQHIILETDASDFTIRAILFQRDNEGKLHQWPFTLKRSN